MKKAIIALVCIVLGVASLSCGSANTEPTTSATDLGTRVDTADGPYWDLTPDELYSIMGEDQFIIQYDTMSTGKIPETDVFITFETLSDNIDKLPQDKSTRIIIYCSTGIRSAEGAAELVKLGYTDVFNLAGGIVAWKNQGYPVIAG